MGEAGATRFEIRRDPAVVDEVEPLCRALHDHNAALAPTLNGLPSRSPDEVWESKRLHYERWLSSDATPAAFVATAVSDFHAGLLAYAFVRSGTGYHGWGSAAPTAVLDSICVAASRRRMGIGTALMDAVLTELRFAAVVHLQLEVAVPNLEAIRFYERFGLLPVIQTLAGPVG